MSPNCNVSDFMSAWQNGLTADASVEQINFISLPALSNRNMDQSVRKPQSRHAVQHTRALSATLVPHYPDSRASENQSKHEPRIIAVCKAHSLRSWRGFRASAVGQQCVNSASTVRQQGQLDGRGWGWMWGQ